MNQSRRFEFIKFAGLLFLLVSGFPSLVQAHPTEEVSRKEFSKAIFVRPARDSVEALAQDFSTLGEEASLLS